MDACARGGLLPVNPVGPGVRKNQARIGEIAGAVGLLFCDPALGAGWPVEPRLRVHAKARSREVPESILLYLETEGSSNVGSFVGGPDHSR